MLLRMVNIVSLVCALLCVQSGAMAQPAASISVVVGIAPYQFLVEQIGGERVRVNTLIEHGQDPHTYEPNPRQILSLSKARILYMAELEFERQLVAKIGQNYKNLQMVELNAGLGLDHKINHQDEGDGHDDGDPHTWMSPILLKKQAENVAVSLTAIDPQGESYYNSNLLAFQRQVDLVYDRIGEILAPFKGRYFLVFHPAFGHFGEAFGLKEKAIAEFGQRPTPRRIAEVIGEARRDGVKIIFVQPQFDQRSAEIIAEAIGGAVVAIDPLAKDVLANYKDIAEKLERAFK